MKGQSQIIQFILFFLIGLGIFLAIGNFFRSQLDLFGEDVGDVNRKLINSYVSSIAISQFITCKNCDNVNTTFKLQNTTANFFVQLGLYENGLGVLTQPGGKIFNTTIHNLAISLKNMSGTVGSPKHIILSLTKTQNKLRVCELGAC